MVAPLNFEYIEGWYDSHRRHQGLGYQSLVTMNFPPERLHWARYAGHNFTDRQRIKRKAERWGRRYAALPVPERFAVLGAMMAVEAEP